LFLLLMLHCNLLELFLEVFGCVFEIALLYGDLKWVGVALGWRFLGYLVRLVVSSECHLVRVDLVPFHIVIDLLYLFLEATSSTGFEEAAVYDLDVAHRVELLVDVS